jgi:predicted GH43/DUF377 family glycosyl hydrolase
MNWKKLKHIFAPDNNFPWMVSHAANPVPFVLNDSIVRVFFSSRDTSNQSSIGYVDVDFEDNFEIVAISREPVLKPGPPGLFDDSGVSMSWILRMDDKFFLYYLGWNLRVTVPWLNTIGLAVANTIDGPFERYSLAPLLDRSNEDPYTVSYPCVIKDGDKYRMWYGSNLAWGKNQEDMAHVIKYAESVDGVNWVRANEVHIPFVHQGEYALSKPSVLKVGSEYRMWYSYRASEKTSFYRIGTAFSGDGNSWQRIDDQVGIDVSSEGWDSKAICYPNVFKFKDNYYMLYNGNDYGKTGFGIAILSETF